MQRQAGLLSVLYFSGEHFSNNYIGITFTFRSMGVSFDRLGHCPRVLDLDNVLKFFLHEDCKDRSYGFICIIISLRMYRRLKDIFQMVSRLMVW